MKLKSIQKASYQQLFDKIAKHLLTQNKRCTNENGACLYRGKDNLRCAVGCLIDDEDYHKDIEGKNAYAIFDILGIKLSDTKYGFLSNMQSIHDNKEYLDWKNNLKKYAKGRGLKWKF